MAVNSGQAEGVDRDDFICWQALMHAAPAAFARQVLDFEDKSIRFGFIQDALKWQNGRQEDQDAVKGFFNAYEDKEAKRLRGVLRQISFSQGFTAETLDAMIYLVAPPATPKPEPETPVMEEHRKSAELETVGETVFAEAAEAPMRGEKGRSVLPVDGNHLSIGGLEFVFVPRGKFIMGSKEDNGLAQNDEKPQHTVDITHDYWMSKFTLTNAQFAEFMDKNKHSAIDWQKPKDHPVVNISWDDAVAYCKWFNETYQAELKAAGNLTLRLPSEAEWEKAARGAYGNEWPWGNEFDPNRCNSAERKGGTTPAGAFSALGGDSPYGCADMAGNVWEWCADWFDESEYKKRAKSSVVDPCGPLSGQYRILRGGSFNSSRNLARCASRDRGYPGSRYDYGGFRVCVSSS
jgi:formylglycine-generating enzyme required for sulfatase activity